MKEISVDLQQRVLDEQRGILARLEQERWTTSDIEPVTAFEQLVSREYCPPRKELEVVHVTEPNIRPAGMTYDRALDIAISIDLALETEAKARAWVNTLERSNFVHKLYAYGWKMARIAEAVGLSRTTISESIHPRGGDAKRPDRTQMKRELLRLHALGLTDYAIAEQLETTRTNIWNWRRAAGLEPNGTAVHLRDQEVVAS